MVHLYFPTIHLSSMFNLVCYIFLPFIQLCTALETSNQLVQSTNTNVASLSKKVEDLQKIVKRGDSAIAAAKALYYVTPDNHSSASK